MILQHGIPVIIDNGSYTLKAGFTGDNEPRSQFRTVVGRPKQQSSMLDVNGKQAYVGKQAQAKKDLLKLTYPVQHRIINDINGMTKIWSHCFYNQLKVNPSEHPCLLTESPRNPKSMRQITTQIMFQSFQVPTFYLFTQAPLSLYSSGRTSGLVIDCGYEVTHSVPIYQGYSVTHAIQANELAGRDLTEYMGKLLYQIGLNYSSADQAQLLNDIKQKNCYVALDYDSQIKMYNQGGNQKDKIYQLPDGKNISIGSQRFRCGQALFNPMKVGKQMSGLHQIAYQSILKCDIEIRKELYNNIVMCGGTTVIEGVSERLNKQITALAPSSMKIKVLAPPQRKFLVWIGGSILSSLSTFQAMWITRAEYQQIGPSIIHTKCF